MFSNYRIDSIGKFLVITLCFLFFVQSLQADEGRAKRPFEVIDIDKARLNVYVPARPEWSYSVEPRAGTYAVILTTPEKFYPQASMEIVLNHRLNVNPIKLEVTALNALNAVREKLGMSEKLTKDNIQYVNYGEIQAYEDTFNLKVEDKNYSMKSIMGIMPSGHPITIFLATSKGQLKHIESMSEKIWGRLKELPEEPLKVDG